MQNTYTRLDIVILDDSSKKNQTYCFVLRPNRLTEQQITRLDRRSQMRRQGVDGMTLDTV